MNEVSSAAAILMDLPLTAIRPSATNPRKRVDAEKLQELADSIERGGLLQPVLCRPVFDPETGDPDVYELVVGSRRFAAVKMIAGASTIRAQVREMSDADVLNVQIIENAQREDIHPAEEAEAYAKLIEAAEFPSDPDAVSRRLTAADVARQVGKPAAHVAARLKLLELGLDAKLLFIKGHLQLEHALLLARLTAADQERALMFMLDADPKYTKRSMTEIIRDRLRARGFMKYGEESEEVDQLQDETIYSQGLPSKAQHMNFGRKLIDATPAQIKRWIEGNVLLQLSNASWRLDDETLVARAGACDVCPKRSGTNAALFAELTASDDICLDPACFAAKQDATVKEQKRLAKVGEGGPLLKLSVVKSAEKMTESAFTSVGAYGLRARATAKTVRAGQWLEAVAASCGSVGEGVLVDGPNKGKRLTVCANQACKVHPHKVNGEERSGSSQSSGPRVPTAADLKREADAKAKMEREISIRAAVQQAMLAKLPGQSPLVVLRLLLIDYVKHDAARVARDLGIAFKGAEADEDGEVDGYEDDEAALPAVEKYIVDANMDELVRLSFALLIGPHLKPARWQLDSDARIGSSREYLWSVAKALGVNPGAIALKMSKPQAKKKVAKKKTQIPSGNDKGKKVVGKKASKAVAKKAVAKKAVAKKAVAKKAVAKKKAVKG